MHGVRFAAADAPVETRIEASTVDIRGTQPEPVSDRSGGGHDE